MSGIPKEIRYKPIGVIHSPFKDTKGMPMQPPGARGMKGSIEVDKEYLKGLEDLDGFSYIIVIFHFHLSRGYSLEVKPFMDESLRGLFSTRTPNHPNPIGISVVRLLRIEGCTLHIDDVDIVDGTPLLDIKRYVPAFDVRKTKKIGWLSEKADKVSKMKADERFR